MRLRIWRSEVRILSGAPLSSLKTETWRAALLAPVLVGGGTEGAVAFRHRRGGVARSCRSGMRRFRADSPMQNVRTTLVRATAGWVGGASWNAASAPPPGVAGDGGILPITPSGGVGNVSLWSGTISSGMKPRQPRRTSGLKTRDRHPPGSEHDPAPLQLPCGRSTICLPAPLPIAGHPIPPRRA
jgi:hypothetical protein